MTPVLHTPLACTSLALALAVVFALAGARKLRQPRAAAAQLDAYELLPAGSGRWIAPPLAAAELLAGAACVPSASRVTGALALVLLLLVYSAAIAASLARGITGIDCGCASLGGEPPLGTGVLLRNGALLCAALACAWCTAALPVTLAQWTTALLLAAVLLAAFAVANAWLARDRWLRDE